MNVRRLVIPTLLISLTSLYTACSTSQTTTIPTEIPSAPTLTPVLPTFTQTSIPPTPIPSPIPPTLTSTPNPPTATPTSVPPSATMTDAPETQASPCEDVEGDCIEVTFDQKTCAHTGPELVQPGQITFIYNNQSSNLSLLAIFKLDEGQTWEDVLGVLAPIPSSKRWPEWFVQVQTGSFLTTSEGSRTREVELTPGTYYWLCTIPPTLENWPGATLVVEN